MKYKWSTRKYWINWLKRDFKKFYYLFIYDFKMGGFNGTMIPTTGKGKFVSTYCKGSIIQIKRESRYEDLKYDEVRLIPCKENHGIMVERFTNGKLIDRKHLDLIQFNKNIIFASNVEELANRK
jgi:hypothetical protein